MVSGSINEATTAGRTTAPNIQKFVFSILEKNSHSTLISVIVHRDYVDSLYEKALIGIQEKAETHGFIKGNTPLNYIEQHFKPHITDHLKELLFVHCVMGALCEGIIQNKLVYAGDPELASISVEPHQNAQFVFRLQMVPFDSDDRWKRLQVKAPERKNYKDIDRQVESFIKEEEDKASQYQEPVIGMGDWVCFHLAIVKDNKQLLKDFVDELWVKINDEEADQEIHELFLGKKKGDAFISKSLFLKEYVSNKLDMNYQFLITVKDFVPHNHVSLDSFKRHFSIKSTTDLHLKLIEIFSYRNDISQRRETVEAVFKLLNKHYPISIPKNLLEYKRHLVLQQVQDNPDYHVYKAQADFKDRIKQLAEKQLREALITDTIAHQENIQVSHEDVVGYLNILKRPRTKEFLYFDTPGKNRSIETPLNTQMLKHYCLREKTLNYIINHLIKK